LKAVAVTGPRRVSVYPEVPTVSESLPGYELTNSYAFFAPAGTPLAIVRRMNEITLQAMHAPETRKVLAADGAEAAPPATPEEFKSRFLRDYAEMEKTIAGANIKLQ
jgi:tripartite-type tricarboxylate transporter receptor subunit TctC